MGICSFGKRHTPSNRLYVSLETMLYVCSLVYMIFKNVCNDCYSWMRFLGSLLEAVKQHLLRFLL